MKFLPPEKPLSPSKLGQLVTLQLINGFETPTSVWFPKITCSTTWALNVIMSELLAPLNFIFLLYKMEAMISNSKSCKINQKMHVKCSLNGWCYDYYYYLPRLETCFPGFLPSSFLLLLVASSRINKSPLGFFLHVKYSLHILDGDFGEFRYPGSTDLFSEQNGFATYIKSHIF